MTATAAGWISVVAIATTTMAIKAAGPILLGGRQLSTRPASVIGLLAPALLAALVATSTLGSGQTLVLDARALGLATAGVALVVRAPTLVVVLVAAVTTALARQLGVA
jgi:uncharacterized membrane protein